MVTKPTAVINRLFKGRAGIVGASRFFNNVKVTHKSMMESHLKWLSATTKGKNLLVIQDTSQYNFSNHEGIIKDSELGLLADNRSIGLHVHPSLVMDLDQQDLALGYSDFQIINREVGGADKHDRKYKNQPIEEKESYRWIEAALNTRKNLSEAESITIVADRESDMYAIWAQIPDDKTHLVLRSRTGRLFEIEQEQGLVSVKTLQKVVGENTVEVKGRPGKPDKTRIAQVEIKAQQATIYKPGKLKSSKGLEFPESVQLYVVEVTEKVPQGVRIKEPLHWILITDKPVETLEQAIAIVEIYKKRWNIEQLFRLTKQKGFGIEESQLETAHGLMNMISMVFLAAVQVLLFVKGRENEELEGDDFFSPIEMEVMQKTIPELEGKAERSKNKRRPNSLAYFIWTIARLGGWKPEDRDPPGPVTMKRGWEDLQTIIKGYKLALKK